MKQRNALSLLIAILAVVFSTVTGFASTTASVPGEYLVKYKDNQFTASTSLRSIAGVRVISHNSFGHLFKVKVSPADEVGSLARIMKDPNVAYVVPNILLHAYEAPVSVEALKDQWALKKIHATEAWTRAGNRGSRNVTVAVIDTGADYNHESLKQNMIPGYDFKNNTTDPMDQTAPGGNPGHGTHCSGIIGATGLADGGVIGISPEVSIMPLRFLDENGSGDLDSGIKAIDYAIQKHVQIISASWGASVATAQAQPLIDAVKRADDAGIIFVMAAANDGKDNDTTDVYPVNAGYPNTIAVAASGQGDEKPSWSNYGKKNVHVASPGDAIMSTLPGNKYGNLSGTSMATPLVSGLVAFLKAQDPSLTGSQTRALLQLTGVKANIQTACNCRVDALAAVDTVLTHKMFIAPAAATLQVGETMQFAPKNANGSVSFQVADASVGSIAPSGLFTASKTGTTSITVKDSAGQTSTSLDIRVLDKNTAPPPGGGGGGGGADKCPLGDQSICDQICQIEPTLPFCKH
jgi:thermitase